MAGTPPPTVPVPGLHRLGREIVALLASAEEDGLDPADYGVDRLRLAVDRAAATTLPSDATARLDAALGAALSRYLTDLRTGRVDPREIHQAYEPPSGAAFDVAAAIAAAMAAGVLAPAVQAATPVVPAYAALRGALARCRAMGAHEAWAEPLAPLPRPSQRGALPKVEPGQEWPGAASLARRLVAWGDLAAMPTPAPTALDDTLVEGLRAFQRRHGLTDDGVLGRATMAALQVTPAQRARQVALTMERLRWTPLMQGSRMIVVNLPEFVLRAYEVDPRGRIVVREQMKVIVGRALDTRTPQFDEAMRFIEFSPYWNVPDSIARKELVPRLRRDPGYFAREGFEFVDRAGRVVEGLTPGRLDAVLAGTLRLRQRPGERNALGDIKFVFPNRDSIFLHHTPATSLFARDRRDLSHGCIRVEHPVALARFVLQDEPGWTEARIREAMAAGTSTTQGLSRPLPVLITYGTALVLGGRLHFFDDVYGHDPVLEAALQRRVRPALPAP
ncbi:MAG: L,D-transpeptidase family protein [Ideonella sp.]|nr:L,D-transpeptidase family protein [Ideonella sp.]